MVQRVWEGGANSIWGKGYKVVQSILICFWPFTSDLVFTKDIKSWQTFWSATSKSRKVWRINKSNNRLLHLGIVDDFIQMGEFWQLLAWHNRWPALTTLWNNSYIVQWPLRCVVHSYSSSIARYAVQLWPLKCAIHNIAFLAKIHCQHDQCDTKTIYSAS